MMKSNNKFCLAVPIALSLNFVLMSLGYAAPTQEQVLQVIQNQAIPVWKKETSEVRRIRLNPPDSNAAQLWQTLDTGTDTSTGKAPLERVTTPTDGKDMSIISTWLRWRILSENADARYSYAYALNLHRMKVGARSYEMDAAIFFFNARLAMLIDGARCLDKSGPEAIAAEFETQEFLQPLIQYIAQMSQNNKAAAMLSAASLEETRGERRLLSYLCTYGIRTMEKALVSGRKPIPMNSNNPEAKQPIGKSYSIDVSGIKPETIPEEQWKKKRRQILDSYINTARMSM